MRSIRRAAIERFIRFPRAQQPSPSRNRFSLVLFDTEIETSFDSKPAADLLPPDFDTSIPRDSTALLDASGHKHAPSA